MKISILPVFIVCVFAFPTLSTLRTRRLRSIAQKEAFSMDLLLIAFGRWTGVSICMGVRGSADRVSVDM